MKMSISRGFTVVELIIVVSVIGILAAIVATSFTSVQKDARDAQVKSSAQKIVEAIQLWSLETRLQPNQIGVGQGSSGVLQNNNGIQSCSSTQGTGGGWLSTGTYPCTMEDALVQMGYLDSDLVSSSPPNTLDNRNDHTYMLYPCAPIANHWLLAYSLEVPSDQDRSTWTTVAGNRCNQANLRTNYNMQSAILIDLTPV